MTQKTHMETKVAEFQAAFETSTDPALWVKLVLEEHAEMKEAAAHLLKECADLVYVIAGLVNIVGHEEADKLLKANGLDTNLGPVLNDLLDAYSNVAEEAFDRVHASNMSKLDDDGKPVRREDGKVLKGPNYKPPVLDDLIV